MDTILAEFESYLFQEKRMARNSLTAYVRDVRGFMRFLRERGMEQLTEVNNATVVSYVLYLKKEGRTASTINRKVASVRAFFNYMIRRGDINENPADRIKTAATERKTPEYLTSEEIELLMSQPDDSTKGVRDSAILELMYATGIKATELIELDINDINLKMSFAAIGSDGENARILPLGRKCIEALEKYIRDFRGNFSGAADSEALFVNFGGGRLTRQGLWKIIREYAASAGIERTITPRILRNSFAVHMLQNGADMKSLQELMGYEDAAAAQVYVTAEKSRIRDVYKKAHPRA